MKMLISFFATWGLTIIAAPPVAAAGLTNAQLAEHCQPQLQTFASAMIAEGSNPNEMKAGVDELTDTIRKSVYTSNKSVVQTQLTEIQNGVASAKRPLNGDNAAGLVVVCMMKALLAEGQSLSKPGAAAPPTPTSPPLRLTKVLEANNPANEASQCLEPIANRDFKRRGVISNSGAVFRNKCAFPVETQWCIGGAACAQGYDNLATMPAKGDRGFSFDTKADTITTIHWAACRLGFGYRPDLKGTLQYVCK